MLALTNIAKPAHTHKPTCDCNRSLGSVHSDPVQAGMVRYYRQVLYHILQDTLRELWVYMP